MKKLSYILATLAVVCVFVVSACGSDSANENGKTANTTEENVEKAIELIKTTTNKIEKAESFDELQEIDKDMDINLYRIFADIIETGEELSNSLQMKLDLANENYYSAYNGAGKRIRLKELRAKLDEDMAKAEAGNYYPEGPEAEARAVPDGVLGKRYESYMYLYDDLVRNIRYTYDSDEEEIYKEYRDKVKEKVNSLEDELYHTEYELPA